MSDEAAFLAALKANPADDLTRLVYADWLDEHGDASKAEYLRQVVDLVRVAQQPGPAGPPEFGRISALASRLPGEWRIAAGARFALVLEEYPQKINAIKQVRELTGMGLGESKNFVEGTPARFPLRTTPESAEGFRRHFTSGRITIAPHPGDSAVAAKRIVFSAYVSRVFVEWEDVTYPPEAVAALRDFLMRALHLSQTQAEERAHQLEYIDLATELEYDQFEALLRDWRVLLPLPEPDRPWNIVIHAYPLLTSN